MFLLLLLTLAKNLFIVYNAYNIPQGVGYIPGGEDMSAVHEPSSEAFPELDLQEPRYSDIKVSADDHRFELSGDVPPTGELPQVQRPLPKGVFGEPNDR